MEKEILKDLKKINEEIKEIGEDVEKAKNPLWYIIGLFLVLIVIAMVVPYYSIRLDPSPKHIPAINEVVPNNIEILQDAVSVTDNYKFLSLLDPSDPVIKRTADMIISKSECPSNNACYAKALFYFVRDNFNYVSDPTSFEYVKTARESLATHNGDCDDGSVLLANLLEAIGIRIQFVFVPRHVYVQAYIPEALKKYKRDGWISLDVTCSYCEFGETPPKYADSEKNYVG